MKKSLDIELVKKGAVKSRSKKSLESTTEMIKHLQEDAESLLAHADKLLARLS